MQEVRSPWILARDNARQQQRRQDRDDGDDHQQFNQREPFFHLNMASHVPVMPRMPPLKKAGSQYPLRQGRNPAFGEFLIPSRRVKTWFLINWNLFFAGTGLYARLRVEEQEKHL